MCVCVSVCVPSFFGFAVLIFVNGIHLSIVHKFPLVCNPMHTTSSLDLLGSNFIVLVVFLVFMCSRSHSITHIKCYSVISSRCILLLILFFLHIVCLFQRIDAKHYFSERGSLYGMYIFEVWTRHFSMESSKRARCLECLLNAPLNNSIIFLDRLGLHSYSFGFGGVCVFFFCFVSFWRTPNGRCWALNGSKNRSTKNPTIIQCEQILYVSATYTKICKCRNDILLLIEEIISVLYDFLLYKSLFCMTSTSTVSTWASKSITCTI